MKRRHAICCLAASALLASCAEEPAGLPFFEAPYPTCGQDGINEEFFEVAGAPDGDDLSLAWQSAYDGGPESIGFVGPAAGDHYTPARPSAWAYEHELEEGDDENVLYVGYGHTSLTLADGRSFGHCAASEPHAMVWYYEVYGERDYRFLLAQLRQGPDFCAGAPVDGELRGCLKLVFP